MTSPSQEQLLLIITAWLAQNYPDRPVSTGLLKRTLAGAIGVGEPAILGALQRGLDRGHLVRLGQEGAAVVALSDAGREQGRTLLKSAEETPSKPSAATTKAIDDLTSLYRQHLEALAKEWAQQSGSTLAPIHVVLAAQSLSAGAMRAAVEGFDRARDKSGDEAAEQKLFAMLWDGDKKE